MDILILIVMVPAAGMIIYALFGLFFPGGPQELKRHRKKEGRASLEPLSDLHNQRILKLEGEVKSLEAELEKTKSGYAKDKAQFEEAISKHEGLKQELSRRED